MCVHERRVWKANWCPCMREAYEKLIVVHAAIRTMIIVLMGLQLEIEKVCKLIITNVQTLEFSE